MEKRLPEINPQELKERLDANDKLAIIDVRKREDFNKGQIETRTGQPIVNAPYLEMLEKGGKGETKASFIQYFNQYIKESLPQDLKSLVITCARGRSSLIVTEALLSTGYPVASLQGGMKAWREYHQFKIVIDSSDLTIIQVLRPARGCLSYFVISEGEAILIDPSQYVQNYIQFIQSQKLNVRYILDTHCHADHISGGKVLAETLKTDYFLHPYDGIHPLDVLPANFAYSPLFGEQELSFGKKKIKILHIPGHTLGNLAYVIDDQYLFAGDSIFIHSISRPDLGGRPEAWAALHYRSLRTLLSLPDAILVLPAHASGLEDVNQSGLVAETLGHLKRMNQGLVMAQQSETEFINYILSKLPLFPEEYIEIKRVNLGLSHLNEEQKLELEAGKNICALASH